MTAALNRQVRSLLARYGQQRVLDAIAAVGAARGSGISSAVEVAPSKAKARASGRTTTRRKSAAEVVERAQVPPEVRPVMERIALAYESKEILPERWRVKKFLASEGVDADRIRSRADALATVVEVLATFPRERLEDLLSGWREHAERGDLAILADAILGPPKTASSAGQR